MYNDAGIVTDPEWEGNYDYVPPLTRDGRPVPLQDILQHILIDVVPQWVWGP